MIWLSIPFAFGLCLAIWMFAIEPKLREVNRAKVFVRKRITQNLKILHLSDTHFAQPDKALFQFLENLSKDDYDFVFISGDILDTPLGLPYALEYLTKFKPQYGTFAVFGNHDYYDYVFSDVIMHNFPGQKKPLKEQPIDFFREAFQAVGIQILMNETAKVNIGDQVVAIHGLDDPTTGKANARKTLQFFDQSDLNILLTHSVDAFLDIGENEIDLSFSGHSHGGQIRFPWIGPIITHTMIGRQYAAGIFNLKGATCCVSRGVGASRSFWPRLLCRPEAIIVTVAQNQG